MGRRKKAEMKKQKGRRKLRKRTQSGGKIPWVVDFKKGFKVTKDMIKAVNTPIDVDKAKRTVEGYKQQYRAYKRRGGTKSYHSWILDKGYGTRDGTKNCCLM